MARASRESAEPEQIRKIMKAMRGAAKAIDESGTQHLELLGHQPCKPKAVADQMASLSLTVVQCW
jgi:hypothetical protein